MQEMPKAIEEKQTSNRADQRSISIMNDMQPAKCKEKRRKSQKRFKRERIIRPGD